MCLFISKIPFLSHSKEFFFFSGTLKVEAAVYPTQGRVSFFSLSHSLFFVLTFRYYLPIYFYFYSLSLSVHVFPFPIFIQLHPLISFPDFPFNLQLLVNHGVVVTCAVMTSRGRDGAV